MYMYLYTCIKVIGGHLVVVLRWRHGDIEHAWRNAHAVSGHRGIAVSANKTQRVVGEMVVLKETWN